MEIKEFIERFAEAIEVEDASNLTAQTVFHDLDEWSSISVLLVIAFYDEEFDKQIGNSEIRACTTIQDLFNLATA